MKRVVCINNYTLLEGFLHEIKIGQIVDVLETKDMGKPGIHYRISGYETNKITGARKWYYSGNFAPIEENTYEDVTKELAKLPVEETPDVKEIKELVN